MLSGGQADNRRREKISAVRRWNDAKPDDVGSGIGSSVSRVFASRSQNQSLNTSMPPVCLFGDVVFRGRSATLQNKFERRLVPQARCS
jgi:hypothetical protein